jgi:prophage regulatory protein
MQRGRKMPSIEVAGRKIIREPEVERRTGRSRTQRWRDIRADKFPTPIELGPNAIGWFEDEIDAWLAERPRRTYRSAEAA